MSCCSGGANSGAYWAGGKWHEMECQEGKAMRMAEMVFGDTFTEPPTNPIFIDIKCECGSDKTYGTEKATHSPYCPKYRRY